MRRTPQGRTLPLVVLSLLVPHLAAQRAQATVEWQKHAATIDYGPVPVGRHSFDELKVDEQWRVGMNEATTWTTEMPLVAGRRVVPPGQYRLAMLRRDETRCDLVLLGSRHALGTKYAVTIVGEVGKADRPAKKLLIDWRRGEAEEGPILPCELCVTFGEHEWLGALQAVGGEAQKVGKLRLTTFALPAELVAARAEQPVPVAVLTRGTGRKAERWNLVLDGAEARIVPWIAVPQESFGFAEIPAPAPDDVIRAELEVVAAEQGVEGGWLELRSAESHRGTLTLAFAAGTEVLSMSLPEPKGSRR